MLRFSHSLRLACALKRPAPGALPPLLRRSSTAAAAAAAAPALAPAPAPAAPPALPPDLITSAGSSLPDLTLQGPSFLDAGLQLWEPLSYVQYGLMQGVAALHGAGGLEWWGAIAAASLGLRAGTFLLCFVRSARMGAWMQHHADALAAFTDRIQAHRAAGDAPAASAATKEYFAFMASKDMNLLKNIAAPALAQIVLFASFFTGLRRLGAEAHLVPGLGGAQAVAGTWLTALHLPDPTFALPALSALLSAASIAANPSMTGVPQAELTPGGQKLVFAGMSTVFSLFACSFPSSVQIYLTVTSASMLAQQGLLRLPAVTRFFGFPADWPLPAEVVAARAAKRAAASKDDANPMVAGMKGFAPVFRVASDLAEGKLRSRPRHVYLGFLGLREPGAPPPPATPPPASQQP